MKTTKNLKIIIEAEIQLIYNCGKIGKAILQKNIDTEYPKILEGTVKENPTSLIEKLYIDGFSLSGINFCTSKIELSLKLNVDPRTIQTEHEDNADIDGYGLNFNLDSGLIIDDLLNKDFEILESTKKFDLCETIMPSSVHGNSEFNKLRTLMDSKHYNDLKLIYIHDT